jgi:hypothetical protein
MFSVPGIPNICSIIFPGNACACQCMVPSMPKAELLVITLAVLSTCAQHRPAASTCSTHPILLLRLTHDTPVQSTACSVADHPLKQSMQQLAS